MDYQESNWTTDTESEFEGGLPRKPSTTIRIGKYIVGKTLGHGSFGKVKQAKHLITGTPVAVKVINRAKLRSADLPNKLQREIRILAMLQHPHITRLYEVIETPTHILLVMELCPGGELFDHLLLRGRLHEDEARRLFQQLVSALKYCHQHGIVHRDLKLENLLLTANGSIKVADFGLANLMQDGEFLRTACGSPNYAAPEVVSSNMYAGPEVDCWSAGVILYAVLVGLLPFDDESLYRLYEKIKTGAYVLPSFLSESSKDLISKMLCVDPLKRITFSEIQMHPWYKHNLRAYLASNPGRKRVNQLFDNENIDEEVLNELLKLKDLQPLQRHRELVMDWLHNGAVARFAMLGGKEQQVQNEKQARHNKLCFRLRVAYDLLLDANIKNSNTSQKRSFGEVQAVAKKQVQRNLTFCPSIQHGQQRDSVVTPDENKLAVGEQSSSKQLWFLGIQTRRDILRMMRKIFFVLQTTLKCQWNVLEPYRIICRWRPLCLNLTDHPKADVWLYASLQVYKTEPGVYMLDFQRIGSHSQDLTWINFCMMFIISLKGLSRAGGSNRAAARQTVSPAAGD